MKIRAPGALNYGLQKRYDMEANVKKNRKKAGMKSFLGGTILTDERVTRQLPFIGLVAFFALVLITNRNWSERTIRRIEVVQDSLEELRAESITLSAKLMDASRPSEVIKKIEEAGIDLEEPVKPPKKLKVKKSR